VKVLEVIRALEEYKRKAENDGNYMEARAATQHLNAVKVISSLGIFNTNIGLYI